MQFTQPGYFLMDIRFHLLVQPVNHKTKAFAFIKMNEYSPVAFRNVQILNEGLSIGGHDVITFFPQVPFIDVTVCRMVDMQQDAAGFRNRW